MQDTNESHIRILKDVKKIVGIAHIHKLLTEGEFEEIIHIIDRKLLIEERATL